VSSAVAARQIAEDAAHFLVLLESGSASADDRARLQHWREQSPHHEQTWQKAQGLRQRFAGLPPELAMASLDRPDAGRRSVLKRALIVAALLPTGWMLAQQAPIAALRADLRTAAGERRDLRLQDGSLLQLDTASALNIDLEQGRRLLTLIEGEMALNMADNVAPMTVQTRQGRVQAIGADLCIRQQGDECLISVWRGNVELYPQHGQLMRLQAGQRATMSADKVSGVRAFDTRQPGWRQGMLSVDNQPLGVFLAELSRYRPGILRWEPELERLKVTGTFRLDNTDQILKLLAASLPVQVVSRTRYWVTLSLRPSSNVSA
jgi:transmembrane sensor